MFDQIPGFLNIRNSFFEFMRKMMWVFFLNLIFIVTSLPIITMGASTTAMYSVLQKLINEREFRLFKDYFSSFKTNIFLLMEIYETIYNMALSAVLKIFFTIS